MLFHLLVMFWTSSDTVAQVFPYLAEGILHVPKLPVLEKINQISTQINFNLGAYGVAIFFLISGFVITLSLRNKSIIQFAINRFCKIWPTYIAGFSITFLMIWIYTKWSGITFPYTAKDWLIQCSILRDWFWVPSIDGVSWTLEAELKFYVLCGIIFYIWKPYDKKIIRRIAVIFFLFNFFSYFLLDYLLLNHIRCYYFVYTISFSNINILYMLLGVCAYNFYSGHWTLQEFAAMLIELYFLLCGSVYFSFERSQLQTYTSSYLFGLLTFLAIYIFQDKLSNLKILDFFDKISYPLYVVHGLNGYIISAFLLQQGVNPWICFGVSIGCAIVIAYLLHITVEKYSMRAYHYLYNRKHN